MFSRGEKNLNRLYHADNGGLCGGGGIGGLLPTNGLGGDYSSQVGIAPQFQDQMGGKMHDSTGVYRDQSGGITSGHSVTRPNRPWARPFTTRSAGFGLTTPDGP